MMQEMEEEVEEDGVGRGSIDFTETSVLSMILPRDTEFDIETTLREESLSEIPSRQALFLDETVNLYVVLQTSYLEETSLESYLGRLLITVDARVVNAQADTHEGPPGKETIWSATLQAQDDPLVIVQGTTDHDDAQSEGPRILVLWKSSIPLLRPRLRLAAPSVVFTATAKLKAPAANGSGPTGDEYLESQMSTDWNLLAAFDSNHSADAVKPVLSAARLTRVSPAAQSAQQLMRSLRNNAQLSVKIFPALNARVRFSKPMGPSPFPSLLASLDIEIPPFSKVMTIDALSFILQAGSVEDLTGMPELELPLTCQPQDEISFLYRLTSGMVDAVNTAPLRTLQMFISATMAISSKCQPRISMRWSTTVDFATALSPYHANPGSVLPVYSGRAHKQTQLSIDSTTTTASSEAALPVYTNPDSLPSMEITTRHQRSHSTVPDFGITMTFTGSAEPIHMGRPFTWLVFIVNRSDRPRKLALLPLPRRRRPTTETRITRPPSTGVGASSSSEAGAGGLSRHRMKDGQVADPVLDENILHALQRTGALDAPELICLSTDTRVGPLAPSSCLEIELRFVALKVGWLTMEACRVVDLGSQEHIDIKDLPSIFVVDKDDKDNDGKPSPRTDTARASRKANADSFVETQSGQDAERPSALHVDTTAASRAQTVPASTTIPFRTPIAGSASTLRDRTSTGSAYASATEGDDEEHDGGKEEEDDEDENEAQHRQGQAAVASRPGGGSNNGAVLDDGKGQGAPRADRQGGGGESPEDSEGASTDG